MEPERFVKTVQFTLAQAGNYLASEPGDQSGEYVRAELIYPLLDALAIQFEDMDSGFIQLSDLDDRGRQAYRLYQQGEASLLLGKPFPRQSRQ